MPKDERESQSCVWDCTVPADRVTISDLRKHFATHCKKYAFQLEVGKGGFRHFQCRISLKTKSRKSTLLTSEFCKFGMHISVTSAANRDNDFYVMKEDTREDGPWTDKDKSPLRTVNKMEAEGLYPWQTSIIEKVAAYDDRTLHVIINREGNIGKSALCKYLYTKYDALPVPPMKDEKDLMQYCMCFEPKKLYLFDLPKSMKKKNLYGLYSGIEQIKNGFMYDTRYHGKMRYIDEPNIVVFTNCPPKMSYLSRDRWKLWTVDGNQNLVPFVWEGIYVGPGPSQDARLQASSDRK